MATLTIRNLSDDTRQRLKELAARHNRSMEAEVRAILETAVVDSTDFVSRWVAGAARVSGELDMPERQLPRNIAL